MVAGAIGSALALPAIGTLAVGLAVGVVASAGLKAAYENIKPVRDAIDGVGDLLIKAERQFLMVSNRLEKPLAILSVHLKEHLNGKKQQLYVAKLVGWLNFRYYVIELHNRFYIIDYANPRDIRNYFSGFFQSIIDSTQFMILRIVKINMLSNLFLGGRP